MTPEVIQEAYDIAGSFYYVEYKPDEYRVLFKVWDVPGRDRDGHLFFDSSLGHLPESPRGIPPKVAGWVKWDGCSDMEFPASEECMEHACSRQALVNFGVLLGFVWDRCVELCPKALEVDDEMSDEKPSRLDINVEVSDAW